VNGLRQSAQSDLFNRRAPLVADDYMLVNSDTTIQDKQSYLEDFRRPGFSLDPYELREPVPKAWNDGAIIGGLLPLGWTQDGFHQTRLLRIARIWVGRQATGS
jgi:hypothetical protein